MDFIDKKLIDYAIKYSQKEPRFLEELRKETYQKVLHPRMLSGSLQGRFLSWLSKLIQPKNILEIGTYTGYGTLCLAEGLSKKGVIHTIDKNEELVSFQKKYFKKSPHFSQINCHLGEAKSIIPKLQNDFDLVFLDADKENYSTYLDLIIPKIKIGGVLLADNVLWSGKVLNPIEKDDKETIAIQKFNQKLNKHPQLETVLLPIRDGLSLVRKEK